MEERAQEIKNRRKFCGLLRKIVKKSEKQIVEAIGSIKRKVTRLSLRFDYVFTSVLRFLRCWETWCST